MINSEILHQKSVNITLYQDYPTILGDLTLLKNILLLSPTLLGWYGGLNQH